MCDEKKHSVANGIASVTQPFIRPIVRDKAKSPVGFGAKYDASINEYGHARLERTQFDPYNEYTILKDIVERHKKMPGRYPRRVLVEQTYRTKDNRAFCKERGIEMPGRKQGRPPDDDKGRRKAEKRSPEERRGPHRGGAVLQRQQALRQRGPHHDEALGVNARQHRARGSRGEPVRRPAPASFLSYFTDAPDGVSAGHMLEIEDEAARLARSPARGGVMPSGGAEVRTLRRNDAAMDRHYLWLYFK